MKRDRRRPAAARPATELSLELRGLELVQSFSGFSGQYNVAWSSSGTLLAADADKKAVAVWSMAAKEPRLLKGHQSKIILGLAWHPSYSILATGSDDRTVRIWEVDADTSRVLCELDKAVRGVSWSPDGSRLAVGTAGGYLSVWDWQNGSLVHSARVHETNINRIY